jgi:replicative DNA helicase
MQHGKDCFLEVDLFVNEDSFTLDYNKVLYKCLILAFETSDNVEYTEILSAARTLGLDELINDNAVIKHIKSIKNTPIRIENIPEHAKRLKRLEFARKLQEGARDIYRNISKINGEESSAHILSLAESPIQDICLSFMREDDLAPKTIGQDLQDYIEHIKNLTGESIGIPTGLSAFDGAIGGGLRRKCVDLIAARPKTGKSCLADNIALNITDNYNIPVLMLDTEMSTEDHWNRMLANLSSIEINEIASGAFTAHEENKDAITMAAMKLEDLPYYYMSIAGRPFEETLSIIKRWLLKTVGYDENGRLNDCVVIYDYLKLMTSENINSNLAEFQVLGFQITALHNFMVENDCPCLAFVQLNRDGITKETTDVVSGSDRLVWLCTSFTIFKDKSEEEYAADGPSCGNKKLKPVVCRHGPGMEDEGYICLQMDGGIAKITELGTIREIKRNANNNQQGYVEQEADDIEEEIDDGGF